MQTKHINVYLIICEKENLQKVYTHYREKNKKASVYNMAYADERYCFFQYARYTHEYTPDIYGICPRSLLSRIIRNIHGIENVIIQYV